jgi:hypothetical protein
MGRHYYSWFDQICHLVACDINIVDHDVQFAKPRCCLVHGATHLLLDRDVVVDEHDVLLSPPRASHSCWPATSLMSVLQTLAPCSLKRCMMDSPMPLTPPVTRAPFPYNMSSRRIFFYRNRCRLVSTRTVVSRYQQGSCRGSNRTKSSGRKSMEVMHHPMVQSIDTKSTVT